MTLSTSRTGEATKVTRGPNQDAVDTAQENVSEGFTSTVKASIISGKPDGDTQGGPGSNNDQGKAPSDPR